MSCGHGKTQFWANEHSDSSAKLDGKTAAGIDIGHSLTNSSDH